MGCEAFHHSRRVSITLEGLSIPTITGVLKRSHGIEAHLLRKGCNHGWEGSGSGIDLRGAGRLRVLSAQNQGLKLAPGGSQKDVSHLFEVSVTFPEFDTSLLLGT
jgi:hypothetical protein